jgi:hypothetical protein
MAEVVSLKPPVAPKVYGTGRVGDNPKALLVMLNWRPTDDQLRYLDEVMKRAVACMPEYL